MSMTSKHWRNSFSTHSFTDMAVKAKALVTKPFVVLFNVLVHVGNAVILLNDKRAYYREIARQRRMLAGLSDEQLKDVGITRADAREEANKSFWQD